jgi:hypothetical protein
MPWVVLVAATVSHEVPSAAAWASVGAIACGLLTRIMLAARFRQPWIGVWLHPVSMLLLTAIQWRSLWLAIAGRRAWRGRTLGRC